MIMQPKQFLHRSKVLVANLMLIGLIILTVSGNSYAGRWDTLEPSNGGDKEILIIKGNNSSYFLLNPGESMTYDISNIESDKIRIITRAKFSSKKKSEAAYTFRIGLDDPKGQLFSRASGPYKGSKVKGKKGIRPGSSRTIEMDVTEDNRELTIRIGSKAKYPVYFRVQNEKEEYSGDTDFVALTPQSYLEAKGISTNERVTTYYLIDDDGRLSIDVIGPTTLKSIARILMDESMRGSIKFGVEVYEDGVLKNTYPLSASVSQVSHVLDDSGLLPSIGEKFFIEVPKGEHRYTFKLYENHKDVILRFFIPEKHMTRSGR